MFGVLAVCLIIELQVSAVRVTVIRQLDANSNSSVLTKVGIEVGYGTAL